MFKILIVDRNPYIRELLQREMMAEGYRVYLAKSGQEVLKWIDHQELIDLMILDINLPDVNESGVLEKLKNSNLSFSVVVHSFISDYTDHLADFMPVAFVEKGERSIEELKKIIIGFLKS
jgi:two-component system alkaline phosphatase synthesis response regulator PhoP